MKQEKESDTVLLLRRCNQGSKMAVNSIRQIETYMRERQLEKCLEDYHDKHRQMGREIHLMLEQHKSDEADPSCMARFMAWCTGTLRLSMSKTPHQAAVIMMNGCNMGIQSLYKYTKQYKNADENAKKIAQNMADMEAKFWNDMLKFL